MQNEKSKIILRSKNLKSQNFKPKRWPKKMKRNAKQTNRRIKNKKPELSLKENKPPKRSKLKSTNAKS